MTPDSPKNESGLTLMIMMGKSIRQIWVNLPVTSLTFTQMIAYTDFVSPTVKSMTQNTYFMTVSTKDKNIKVFVFFWHGCICYFFIKLSPYITHVKQTLVTGRTSIIPVDRNNQIIMFYNSNG